MYFHFTPPLFCGALHSVKSLQLHTTSRALGQTLIVCPCRAVKSLTDTYVIQRYHRSSCKNPNQSLCRGRKTDCLCYHHDTNWLRWECCHPCSSRIYLPVAHSVTVPVICIFHSHALALFTSNKWKYSLIIDSSRNLNPAHFFAFCRF